MFWLEPWVVFLVLWRLVVWIMWFGAFALGCVVWALDAMGFGALWFWLGRHGLVWGCFGRMLMYLDGVCFWIGLWFWPDWVLPECF